MADVWGIRGVSVRRSKCDKRSMLIHVELADVDDRRGRNQSLSTQRWASKLGPRVHESVIVVKLNVVRPNLYGFDPTRQCPLA